MPTRPNTSAASTLVAEPVTDITPATTYIVKSGDSLWSIASKNHLTYIELAAVNGLKANAVLQPGHKLLTPGKKPAAATAASAAPAASAAKIAVDTAAATKSATSDQVKYTVKSGDTLGSIAKAFDVKLADIAVANHITDPQKVRAGMVLVIPGGGWQTPGSKAAKAGAKSGAPGANGKAAADSAKPLFNAPATDADSPIKAAPPPTGSAVEVPVIKVEDAPAPKKP